MTYPIICIAWWLALTAYLEAIRPAVPGRTQACSTQVMQGGRGGGGVASARGGGGRAPAVKDEREVREVAPVQGGAKTACEVGGGVGAQRGTKQFKELELDLKRE